MKLKPSTEPKIILAPSTEPPLRTDVMNALGAEPAERPPFVLANSVPLHDTNEKNREYSISVSQEEWEQLVALAQELTSEEQAPTPKQVGRALLHKALVDLMQGKQQLKASLQEKPAQAAE
jgi:hypothetical protein